MKYSLVVDESAAPLLLHGLAELPYKVSADLISDLVAQISQQKADHASAKPDDPQQA